MAFEVRILVSARKELEAALHYYHKISPGLAKRYYSEFLDLNRVLTENPFFAVKNSSIRTTKLKSFPYLVHFIVNEDKNVVTILAIIFGKQEKNRFEDSSSNE